MERGARRLRPFTALLAGATVWFHAACASPSGEIAASPAPTSGSAVSSAETTPASGDAQPAGTTSGRDSPTTGATAADDSGRSPAGSNAGDRVADPIDPDGAVEVWERWARALVAGDLETANTSARDAANLWVLITQVVASADAAAGYPHRFSGSVGDVRIREQTTDRVALEAELLLREEADNGLDRGLRITDPVLRATEGSWRVASFVMDDVPLGWQPVGETLVVAGVHHELVALVHDSRSTWAVSRLSVPEGQERAMRGGDAWLLTQSGRIDVKGSEFSAGRVPVGAWRFPHVDDVFEVVLPLVEGDERHEFRWRLGR